MSGHKLDDAAERASQTIAEELHACTTKSSEGSHTLCQYVLENVLLHQAAAQQLQGTAANLVNSGQQLLATTRQLAPQLEQLDGMAQAAKQLKAKAEQLKQLSSMLQQQPAAGQQNAPTQSPGPNPV